MNPWPLEANCKQFYGNPMGPNGLPSAAWQNSNLILVRPPFIMRYAGTPIRGISTHRRCAESLSRILYKIWDNAKKEQAIIDRWGVSIFGGCFNPRLKRGGSSLSIHSYAAAIDLDPERNAFHDLTPNFADIPEVVKPFEDEYWEWGGRWGGRSKDGMHFQAARTR